MKNKKKETTQKIATMICGVGLTICGFIVFPPLIKKFSNKLYKSSLSHEKIDFEDMGPEIKKNHNAEETKEV